MLIPIGFFGGGAAAGAYELITTAYGTGSSGSITFSSIPQTYKHLQIRALPKFTDGIEWTGIGARFNGDSGTNYSGHNIEGAGSGTPASFGGETASALPLSVISRQNGNSTNYVGVIWDLYDYASTTKYKSTKALSGGFDGQKYLYITSGTWRNTNAVTQIEILPETSRSFTTGSRFSLYGIKG